VCRIYTDHSSCGCLSMLVVVHGHEYFFGTNISAVELLNPVKPLTPTLPLLSNLLESHWWVFFWAPLHRKSLDKHYKDPRQGTLLCVVMGYTTTGAVCTGWTHLMHHFLHLQDLRNWQHLKWGFELYVFFLRTPWILMPTLHPAFANTMSPLLLPSLFWFSAWTQRFPPKLDTLAPGIRKQAKTFMSLGN